MYFLNFEGMKGQVNSQRGVFTAVPNISGFIAMNAKSHQGPVVQRPVNFIR